MHDPHAPDPFARVNEREPPHDRREDPAAGQATPPPGTALNHNEVLSRVRARQREDWQRGECHRVETYLQAEPTLRDDAEAVLDLVARELWLREERGETPELTEYLDRFPHLADQLRQQFELHRALYPKSRHSEWWVQTLASPPPGGAPGGAGAGESGSLPWPTIAGYEILAELGRGGMGVVYKARQVSLGRLVALKMILSGAHAGPEERSRFRIEAEAVAQLQHPNIVQLYEVGEQDGRPYYSLEFIDGGSLEERLGGRPQPPAKAAELVEALAGAVATAHRRGIIHRDLKPGNILLTSDGAPKITDFGLAKRLDSPFGATRTGDILGTPQYMAPEQAAGRVREIGPWTDIYALGTILYDLLTGRPPFQAASVLETLELVRTQDPLPPRRLQRKLPVDLETICLKCLEKDPRKRYATAEELAEDLCRFRRGEPIRARPTPMWERGWKWVKRNPTKASLAATLLAAALALLAMGAWSYRTLQLAHADTERRVVQLNIASGRKLVDEGNLAASLVFYAEALRLEAGDPEREALHRMRIAAILRQIPPRKSMVFHANEVQWVEFSPDGQRLVTASSDWTARIWDWGRSQPLGAPMEHGDVVNQASFSPDGSRVVTVSDDRTVRLWDARTGRPISPPLPHGGPVRQALFSQDGRWLVTAADDQRVYLWDVALAQLVYPAVAVGSSIGQVALSGDRRWLAVGGDDGKVRIWDVSGGPRLVGQVEHAGAVRGVAFAPDSRRLASASVDRTARVWDVRTTLAITPPLPHEQPVRGVVFSPDGRWLATASDDVAARIWDAATGQLHGEPLRHASTINHVCFSPDSRLLATASDDNSARVWDVASSQPVTPILPHNGSVVRVAIDISAAHVALASDDNTATVWAIRCAADQTPRPRHDGPVRQVHFSPDGRLVLTCSRRQARLWDPGTGASVGRVMEHDDEVLAATFSPDGQRLATASRDHKAGLWDARSGQRLGPLLVHDSPVVAVAFSLDGRLLATACTDGQVRLWDGRDGTARGPAVKHPQAVTALAFSPDGRLLATASVDEAARIWDVNTSRLAAPKLTHQHVVNSVAFDPTGRYVVTASEDQTAQVWNVADGSRAGGTMKHASAVKMAAFDPTGTWVLTSGGDNTARLWDWRRAEARGRIRPLQHHGTVHRAELSADGRLIVTASEDNSARVWDAATGTAITPPLRHQGSHIAWATFSPDGRWVATAGGDGTVRLWELDRDDRPLAAICREAQLLGVATLDYQGAFVPLTSDELRAIWEQR
ncbi:MAG: serine/threonine protein kinase [Gemmataceae bacterium]|nr:serine/threonine protein kinase [Gemmataceae bacterium]MDW8265833.1 serine/threonine-protein kinase [Gemmataceae bacterium]